MKNFSSADLKAIAALSRVSISTLSRVAIAQQQGVLNNLHSGRLLLNNLMVFAPAARI